MAKIIPFCMDDFSTVFLLFWFLSEASFNCPALKLKNKEIKNSKTPERINKLSVVSLFAGIIAIC